MTSPISPSELVETYQVGVWRYLRFLGCSEAEADDLVQETFMAVLRKPFEQRSSAQSGAYLRTVARNQFLMFLRRQRREVSAQRLDVADEVWNDQAGESWGAEYIDALGVCLEGLGERARQAIQLRYNDDASRSEMAEAIGMTEEGIKTLLRRTRQQLKECVLRRLKS